MNAHDVKELYLNNPDMIAIYPKNRLIKVGGILGSVVNFPMSPPRYKLAMEFSVCLRNPAAKQQLHEFLSHKSEFDITEGEWDHIGELEGLPEFEPIPPELIRKLNNQREIAAQNTIFTQSFVDTIEYIIRSASTENHFNRVSCPLLLEGTSRTFKSKAIQFAAAALNRPCITVDCATIGSYELREKLKYTETSVVNIPTLTALEAASNGTLKSPIARRELIELLTTHDGYKNFPDAKWEEIAQLEGIKKGQPYVSLGPYEVAKKYGAILNFEELNKLKPTDIGAMKEFLENDDDKHPNLFITASMRSASKSDGTRYALPDDVRNCFTRFRFTEPHTDVELRSMAKGFLLGISPEVQLLNQTFILSASDFGLPEPSTGPEKVMDNLSNEAFDSFLKIINDNSTEIQSMIKKIQSAMPSE